MGSFQRITVQVRPDSSIMLERTPFRAGKFIEVILLPLSDPAEVSQPLSHSAMHGSVLHYDDPFAPATDPDDWNAVGGE